MLESRGPRVRTEKDGLLTSKVITWGVSALVLLSVAAPLSAQTTAQFTITATVQPSITLVFNNNPSVGSTGFCPLTSSGTNAVGLDLGSASFTGGSTLACVAFSHVGGAHYQVASSFDVLVSKANTTSPNYRLSAQISTPPPSADVAWLLSNQTLTTAMTALTADTANAYGTAKTKTLQVQVKNNVAAGTLSETVTFLATAN
jgi:hypothetical protein